jgi:hypothetical protein
MCSSPARAISCAEHARLEEEYIAIRDRMRDFLKSSREAADLRLRELTRIEQRRLADKVAMAIARLKEHAAAHGCARRQATAYSNR